jgi:hypothetical protein
MPPIWRDYRSFLFLVLLLHSPPKLPKHLKPYNKYIRIGNAIPEIQRHFNPIHPDVLAPISLWFLYFGKRMVGPCIRCT